MSNLESIINNLWQKKNENNFDKKEAKETIDHIITKIDKGELRVAEKNNNEWQVNQWIKKAILLSFTTNEMQLISGGPGVNESSYWYDKVKSKFEGWNKENFIEANFRAVPNTTVRFGSYIGKNVVLMPSFINLGAYIDDGTMIDTWTTIGSCAQIGKNCHISGGVGIGGVLEPLQANPVIIEDNCFIGARSEIAEGVIIREGSVISMGVYLGQSTKIIDRDTGNISYGEIPPYSVVVAGNVPAKKEGDPSLYCAVIVKKVDSKTRSKTSINELLRD
jgi:2,3,4,5-tetrahydropyridine-2-carboxylate N-succinyltransferase